MKVSELGEFALIDLISDIVGKAKSPDVVLGVGDDAAVWRCERSLQIGTTDSLVQDVHFDLDVATWRDLGWKALAVNISDIAAMGGIPQYALVSLSLPLETEVECVTELCHGMVDIANEFSVDIVGGNITRSPVTVITLSVIGKAQAGSLLTRSAALAGDVVAVTGYLGQSAAGLRMLKSRLKFDDETTAYLKDAHLRPYPRVAQGQVLVEHGVKSAIDLSDGLLSDLAHIGEASGVAAKIWLDRLPVHHLVKSAFVDECPGMALSGGEDYELLFTARDSIIEGISRSLASPVTVIGEVVSGRPGAITLLDKDRRVVEWDGRGWDHFKE
ncbi:thiamine-phosphate kinase [Chloroflexota bacterium]